MATRTLPSREMQFRLLWNIISTSKKIRDIEGARWFRLACHVTYTWMIAHADDDGRLRGDPIKILANIVPYEELTDKEIVNVLTELDRIALINWYAVEDELFVQIADWGKYQRIRKDRYRPSIYPPYKKDVNGKEEPEEPKETEEPAEKDIDLLSPREKHAVFEEFIKLYPIKTNRKKAEKYFNEAVKKEIDYTGIKHKLIKQIDDKNKLRSMGKFVPEFPAPDRYIRDRRYEDIYCQDSKVIPAATEDTYMQCPTCNSEVLKEDIIKIDGQKSQCKKCFTVSDMPEDLMQKINKIGTV